MQSSEHFDNSGCCNRLIYLVPHDCGWECGDPSQHVDRRHQCRREQWFVNDEVSYTAQCPCGSAGDPVTVIVPAGLVPSTVSIEDANALALILATDRANAELKCSNVYFNAEQTAVVECPFGPDQEYTTSAGQFTSTESQAAADALAYDYAVQQAQAQCGNVGAGEAIVTFEGEPIYTFGGKPITTMV